MSYTHPSKNLVECNLHTEDPPVGASVRSCTRAHSFPVHTPPGHVQGPQLSHVNPGLSAGPVPTSDHWLRKSPSFVGLLSSSLTENIHPSVKI